MRLQAWLIKLSTAALPLATVLASAPVSGRAPGWPTTAIEDDGTLAASSERSSHCELPRKGDQRTSSVPSSANARGAARSGPKGPTRLGSPIPQRDADLPARPARRVAMRTTARIVSSEAANDPGGIPRTPGRRPSRGSPSTTSREPSHTVARICNQVAGCLVRRPVAPDGRSPTLTPRECGA